MSILCPKEALYFNGQAVVAQVYEHAEHQDIRRQRIEMRIR